MPRPPARRQGRSSVGRRLLLTRIVSCVKLLLQRLCGFALLQFSLGQVRVLAAGSLHGALRLSTACFTQPRRLSGEGGIEVPPIVWARPRPADVRSLCGIDRRPGLRAADTWRHWARASLRRCDARNQDQRSDHHCGECARCVPGRACFRVHHDDSSFPCEQSLHLTAECRGAPPIGSLVFSWRLGAAGRWESS